MPFLNILKSLTRGKITVYADFIDPFCYIGFHTLKTLADSKGLDLEWRGFELNPGTPPEGLALVTAENSDLRPGMWASVRGLAERAGLAFPEPQWVPNTRRAHALVEGVKNLKVKNPLIERIYQAYFKGQRDIGRVDVLMDVTADLPISKDHVQEALEKPNLPVILETHRDEARRRGFLGLPGYIYKGKTYFGALSPDAWNAIISGKALNG